MDEPDFGVPAGWYPDPLGLPQLRWWDSLAWTEHTSEARAPIVIHPAKRAEQADEDLPSRREQRERERRDAQAGGGDGRSADESGEAELILETDDDSGELSAQPLLAMTLRELQPPAEDTVEGIAPGPRPASEHANRYGVSSSGLPAFAEDLRSEPARGVEEPRPMRTYTAAAWVVAVMPALQLVTSIALLLSGAGDDTTLMILVWTAPYVLVLGLAAYDRLELRTLGHERRASALWALLTSPAYLLVRAIRTVRQTRAGFAPLVVSATLSLALLASIVALPGLVISVLPAVFSNEVEQSVRNDAAALGVDLVVTCPGAPPLMVGEWFSCRAEEVDGEADLLRVSLQRENGWVAWQVDNWALWARDAGD